MSVDVDGRVFASGSVVEEGATPVGRGTKPKDAETEPKGGKTTTGCGRAEMGDTRVEPEDRASKSTAVCDGSKLEVMGFENWLRVGSKTEECGVKLGVCEEG